jgi:hypothetical protein
MFHPKSLEEAETILALAKSTVAACIAKIECPLTPDDDLLKFCQSSLINLIQSDRTGFLAISMCDRLSESIPRLERLVELIKSEADQQGG